MLLRNVVTLFFIVAGSVCAQQDNGSILGTVTDSSGAVVAGASVEIRNLATGQITKLVSDSNGDFFAPVLPVGTYRLSVANTGFKVAVVDGLTLQVADRLKLTVKLEPGTVQETVTVTGVSPLVDTASTTLGGVVTSQQINALPMNGRDIVELLALVPGMVLLGGATQQSINGASAFRQEGGLHFLVDGADASRVDFDILENTYGSSRGRVSRASPDAIEEFRVQASSYSAEYGQALGGVVNIVTKSGTNQFHGSLFEYFRNEKLDKH
jgi:outer membrane receptor for ferrienterochelin and colicin